MRFSYSSVYTTILICNILIVAAACLLRHKSILLKSGYRCMGLVLGLVTMRMLLPFEFPFTRSLHLPGKLSELIIRVFNTHYHIGGYVISSRALLGIVWLCGTVYLGLRFLQSILDVRRLILNLGHDVTRENPYAAALSSRQNSSRAPFRILLLPGIQSPMLYGLFSPRILLPQRPAFSQRELQLIVSHELSHYRHGDLLVKYFFHLLSILYWWNPLCRILKRQAELLVEIRVDESIVQKGQASACEYLECLLRVAEHSMASTAPLSGLGIGLTGKSRGSLTRRFEILMGSAPKPPARLRYEIALCAILLFLASHLFVLVPTLGNPDAFPENFDSIDIYRHGIHVETVPLPGDF